MREIAKNCISPEPGPRHLRSPETGSPRGLRSATNPSTLNPPLAWTPAA